MKNTLLLSFLFFLHFTLIAQNPAVTILHSGTATSLRGLSVVNDNVIWVSGSHGTVGKSTNAGKNWKWSVVKGFEKTEFRDIEAFDSNVAIIMGIGEPAYILKTTDGGDSWKIVFENRNKGMFLDAMDFSNNQDGLVIGDPVNGKAFVAMTSNSGNSWEELQSSPLLDSGEAFFAASGGNLRYFSNHSYVLVSGGLKTNIHRKNSSDSLPLDHGTESSGANAIDVYDNGQPDKPGKKMIVVGGDFSKPDLIGRNCIYTTNGGRTWKKPITAPHGYRSSVEYLSAKIIISCGINGVDLSTDAGKNWTWISREGFNTCRIARIGTSVFLVGNKGKIAKFTF